MPKTPSNTFNTLSQLLDKYKDDTNQFAVQLKKFTSSLSPSATQKLYGEAIRFNLFNFDNLPSLASDENAKSKTPISDDALKDYQSSTKVVLHLILTQQVNPTNLDPILNELVSADNDLQRLITVSKLDDEFLDSAISSITDNKSIKGLKNSILQEAKGFLFQLSTYSPEARRDIKALLLKSNLHPSPKALLKVFDKHAFYHPFSINKAGNLTATTGNSGEPDAMLRLKGNKCMVLLATADRTTTIEGDSIIRHPLATLAFQKLMFAPGHSTEFNTKQAYKQFFPDTSPQDIKSFTTKELQTKIFKKLSSGYDASLHTLNFFDTDSPSISDLESYLTAHSSTDPILKSAYLDEIQDNSKALFFGNISSLLYTTGTSGTKDDSAFFIPDCNLITERAILYIRSTYNSLNKLPTIPSYVSNNQDNIPLTQIPSKLLSEYVSTTTKSISKIDTEKLQQYSKDENILFKDLESSIQHPSSCDRFTKCASQNEYKIVEDTLMHYCRTNANNHEYTQNLVASELVKSNDFVSELSNQSTSASTIDALTKSAYEDKCELYDLHSNKESHVKAIKTLTEMIELLTTHPELDADKSVDDLKEELKGYDTKLSNEPEVKSDTIAPNKV